MGILSFGKKKRPSHMDIVQVVYENGFKGKFNELLFPDGIPQVDKVIRSLSTIIGFDLSKCEPKQYLEITMLYSLVYTLDVVTKSTNQAIMNNLQRKFPQFVKDKEIARNIMVFVFMHMNDHSFSLDDKETKEKFSLMVAMYIKNEEITAKNGDAAKQHLTDDDYGKVKEKPIYVEGGQSIDKYLASLVTEDGDTLSWKRVEALGVSGINGLVDKYEGTLSSGQIYDSLYFNLYSSSTSTTIPIGFAKKENELFAQAELATEAQQELFNENGFDIPHDDECNKSEESQLICNKCNQVLPGDSDFCQYCGEKLDIKKRLSPQKENNENAWLLAWNPKTWDWEDIKEACRLTRSGSTYKIRWSCISGSVKVGDRVYITVLGTSKNGIIASGYAISGQYEYEHWNEEKRAQGKKVKGIDIELEYIVDFNVETPLSQEFLKSTFPEQHWSTQASGISIKSHYANELYEEWTKHISENHCNISLDVDTASEVVQLEVPITSSQINDAPTDDSQKNNSHKHEVESVGEAKQETPTEIIIPTPSNDKKAKKKRYCKMCGGLIDSETKKCTSCGKQYFKSPKINIGIIISAMICLLLIASNIITFVMLAESNSTISEQERIIARQKSDITSLKSDIASLKENVNTYKNLANIYFKKAKFMDDHIVIIGESNNKYHKFGCADLDTSAFWAYADVTADYLGYRACSKCN